MDCGHSGERGFCETPFFKLDRDILLFYAVNPITPCCLYDQPGRGPRPRSDDTPARCCPHYRTAGAFLCCGGRLRRRSSVFFTFPIIVRTGRSCCSANARYDRSGCLRRRNRANTSEDSETRDCNVGLADVCISVSAQEQCCF